MLSKNELNNKFQHIQKELTKNNIYHMHIVLFCFKEDIEKIRTITNNSFVSDINKNKLSFQKVFREKIRNVIQYVNKIHFNNDISKQESKLISYSEIRFFGIEKIIKEYDRIYKKDFSEMDFQQYQNLGI
ncbi:hypothetical protein HK27_14315 [Acetobacter orientalis]|nr:hypothetical protein HK27_14315 [Acetobacter orientalis]